MRRTNVLIFTGIIIFGSALVSSMLIRFPTKKTVVIHAPVDEVSAQFSKITNLKNWYPDPLAIVSITGTNPLSKVIRETKGSSISDYLITATPVENGIATIVDLEEKTNGLGWLQNRLSDNPMPLLKELKLFMEDDSRRYGFPIRVIPVTDTLILTTARTVAPDQQPETVNDLRHNLREFISSNGIAVSGDYYYTSTASVTNGLIEVAIGIPVRSVKNEEKGFRFLRLPETGRLLAGDFKDYYSQKAKLYAAMDKYVLDKRFKKVAQPLEKFCFADTGVSELQKIRMTVYYPIY